MSNVNIILDQYEFFPGTVLSGKAVCDFKSSKEVRKVSIRLKGEESTHWIGRERHYDDVTKKHRYESVSYYGDRDFLLRDHLVHGEGTMGVGEHVFPFEFSLPEDLPSSFTHRYGKIRYSVKLNVDRPWKTDYDSEKEITMISPVKLQSLSLSLLQPVEFSDEKMICCLCCTSGPIQLDVNLEKRAFVVGEHASIKVNCSNMTNVQVESINAEIKMNMTFKANRPMTTNYIYDSELVATSPNSGVGAHGDKTFNLNLEIPPSTVVPNFRGCEFFSCDSVLQVTAAISGCHKDIVITTDVALGHIPFFQEHSEPIPGYKAAAGKAAGLPLYPGLGFSGGPSAPQEIGAPSAPSKLSFGGNPPDLGSGQPSANDAPPPTYDEASKEFK